MKPFLDDRFHKRQGKLFVISGPSASGKTSVVAGVQNLPGIWFSVSATTRAPRNGEKEGIDYFYISKKLFEQKISNGEFLEHAVVHGNLYGTPADPIKEKILSGVHVILDIDAQGAMQIQDKFPEAVMIYLLPPGRDVLEQRLRDRNTEDDSSVLIRLSNADAELKFTSRYRYLVINDLLDAAIEDIKAIIRAETLLMPEGGIEETWHKSEQKS